MSRQDAAVGFRAAAFGVLLAFCAAVRGLGFRLTARDALLNSPQNCDAACQEAWRSYSGRGDNWFLLAGVLFAFSLVIGFLIRRRRGNIG